MQSWHGLAARAPALNVDVGNFLDAGQRVVHEGSRQVQPDRFQVAELQRPVLPAKLDPSRVGQLLASSLETLDVGLEIWDEEDRLIFYNEQVNLIHAGFHTPAHIGQTFETLMRGHLRRHLIVAAIGREEEWLAQRLARRAKPSAPEVQEFAGDRWINIHETRTPDACLVTVRIDVTELVHKRKALEASNHQLILKSTTDGLTGLANRRYFDEVLTTEWQRATRSGAPLSLLMVDIDHFKRFNDHYGHLAGDDCLRRVAGVLGQCVRRAGEMVARYGGEEFVLLLPAADMAHACETAQKCLDLMEQESIRHAASPTAAHVTLSIGVACLLPEARLDPCTLVNAADVAMYHAKSGGRAHFQVASQEDWNIDKDTPRTRPAPLI